MDPDYEEIRQRITRRYNNRAEFWSHVVAYIVSSVIVWRVLSPVGLFFTIAAVIMGFWGMGLVIHAVQYLMKEAQERAIERAIDRERSWRWQADETGDGTIKRKRDRLTLKHDDAMLEVVEDDVPARRRR